MKKRKSVHQKEIKDTIEFLTCMHIESLVNLEQKVKYILKFL
jgi:hypothetical protein